MSFRTDKERRLAREVFDKLMVYASCLFTFERKPGILMRKLTDKEAADLKHLKSEDIQDRIK